jgi:hypothetical protein
MRAATSDPRSSPRATAGGTVTLTRRRPASWIVSSGATGVANAPGSTLRCTMVPANGAVTRAYVVMARR